MQSETTTVEILEAKSQYQHCHIYVPDLEQRLSAIYANSKYYSFLKIVPNRSKALEIAARLQQRHDEPILTITPKGYAIWVWEPEASRERQLQHPVQLSNSSPQNLISPSDYQPRRIRVPDLDQALVALEIAGQYYSLLRIEKNLDKAVEVVTQLERRQDQGVMTETPKGYAIWVLEPEAYLA